MDKFDRIFEFDAILRNRHTPISLSELSERLGCKQATTYRLINLFKERFNAPIESHKDPDGYRYRHDKGEPAFQLPGLWFNADELQALIVFDHLLENLETGLLTEHLAPFARRIHQLIEHRRLGLNDAADRIRVLGMSARSTGKWFNVVAAATLERRQLELTYFGRDRNARTERTVSPQRLVRYRDNWHLDAWCHLRKGLRIFAVERIENARKLEEPSQAVDEQALQDHFASAYGIFAGKANKEAVLRFSAERARWVADERWHPEQQGQYAMDGSYELRIRYRDERELIMDILRHGPHVEVISPPSLRKEVADQLNLAMEKYRE